MDFVFINPTLANASDRAHAVSEMITSSSNRKSTIDNEAARWLTKVGERTWMDTPFTLAGVYNPDSNDSSCTELDLIRKFIPTGPPDVVPAWWASLSLQEFERVPAARALKHTVA
ncbi:MAG: hypothetical protein ACRDP6_43030 [Actinoallomurus sp.]